MSDKICDLYEVSAGFANCFVMGDWPDVFGGEWLVISRDPDGGMVHVVDLEYCKEFAVLYAKCSLRDDELHERSRDYEIWHVQEYVPELPVDVFDEDLAC